jgi:hypothetical protein
LHVDVHEALNDLPSDEADLVLLELDKNLASSEDFGAA